MYNYHHYKNDQENKPKSKAGKQSSSTWRESVCHVGQTASPTWTCLILVTERAVWLIFCLEGLSVPSVFGSPTRVSRDIDNNICWPYTCGMYTGYKTIFLVPWQYHNH